VCLECSDVIPLDKRSALGYLVLCITPLIVNVMVFSWWCYVLLCRWTRFWPISCWHTIVLLINQIYFEERDNQILTAHLAACSLQFGAMLVRCKWVFSCQQVNNYYFLRKISRRQKPNSNNLASVSTFGLIRVKWTTCDSHLSLTENIYWFIYSLIIVINY